MNGRRESVGKAVQGAPSRATAVTPHAPCHSGAPESPLDGAALDERQFVQPADGCGWVEPANRGQPHGRSTAKQQAQQQPFKGRLGSWASSAHMLTICEIVDKVK